MPHTYHPHCGCHACGLIEEADERDADQGPDMGAVVEAAEWTAGDMPAAYYEELDLALFELAEGSSDALVARLANLAKSRRAVIEARLEAVAQKVAA
jgi:hypothetical protein